MNRKTIFDAVRRLLGRRLQQDEVDALDDAIDRALADETAPQVREIGPEGIALIKAFEGLARVRPDGLIEAYPDPGSRLARTGSGSGEPWTIGWGATGPDIGQDTVWTRTQADERLIEDIERHARDVAEAIGNAPTSQAQFDALVSFHYNTGAIRRATLTKRHRDGDFDAAANEFARWNRAGGRVLQGLVRRRRAEADLYRSGT